MRVLAPIPGDGEACLALAAALTGSAAHFAAAAADLHTVTSGALWEGPAGVAFAARVGSTGPTLEAAADRYAACAAALRRFAPVLTEAQRRALAATEEHADATRRYALLEEEVWRLVSVGRTELDPEVIVLRAAQHGALARQEQAGAAHARAWADVEAADRECARELQRAADDALADSAAYRLVLGASSGSEGSDLLTVPGMLLPPVGAAVGVVNTGADGLLRAFWDEGGWDEVAVNAALAGAGGWGRVLKRGAVLGAVEDTTRQGSRTVRTVRVEEHWTTGARLREGLKAEGRASAQRWVDRATATGGGPLRFVPVGEATPTRLTGAVRAPSAGPRARLTGTPAPRGGLSRQVVGAAEDRAAGMTLGWRLASANGPEAQRMYAAGITLEKGAKYAPRAVEKVESLRERDARTDATP